MNPYEPSRLYEPCAYDPMNLACEFLFFVGCWVVEVSYWSSVLFWKRDLTYSEMTLSALLAFVLGTVLEWLVISWVYGS